MVRGAGRNGRSMERAQEEKPPLTRAIFNQGHKGMDRERLEKRSIAKTVMHPQSGKLTAFKTVIKIDMLTWKRAYLTGIWEKIIIFSHADRKSGHHHQGGSRRGYA